MTNNAKQIDPATNHRNMLVVCFGVLGWLTAPANSRVGMIIGFIIAGFVIGGAGIQIIAALLRRCNRSLAPSVERPALDVAIMRGYLLLIPFTLLALLADKALGWDSVHTFTAAGMMTGGALAGGELVKLGGKRLVNTVTPILAGVAFTICWTIAAYFIQVVGGGR